METFSTFRPFRMDGMFIQPIHIRIEKLHPVIAAHRHSDCSYELHYCASGSGKVFIEGREYAVSADTLYTTGPNLLHAQRCNDDEPITEYCLYLNCRKLKPDDHPNLFLDTAFWIGQDKGRLFPLLQALITEQRTADSETEMMSEALIRQIIGGMIRGYRFSERETVSAGTVRRSSHDTTKYPVLEDAFFYDYATLKLEDLSSLLNLSVRQTQRFLKTHYGKTFMQKKTDARMAASAQLLTDTSMSITEIAEKTGFSNIEHFSTAFRRYYHVSPREYRIQRRSETQAK